MNSLQQKLNSFSRLLEIMEDLREKCPWDQKQTMETLRPLTIEEIYELGDAILDADLEEVKKELGDIMLHMVFYSKIASEKGAFDIADVLNGICEKLISRHPHIYGDLKVSGEEEVKSNWEKLKLKEGKKSVLSGVPNSLPSMVKATRIQEKARGIGFDWEKTEQVWEKVNEELEELKVEVAKNDMQKIEAEFGDLLFSIINLARFLKVDPESALERTNKKFIKRFTHIEETAVKNGSQISDLSLDEMERIWQEAKSL